MSPHVTNGSDKKGPLLLFTPFPGEGHVQPLVNIAAHARANNYDVVFMATVNFQKKLEELGAEWIQVDDPFTGESIKGLMAAMTMPLGIERLSAQLEWGFVSTATERTRKFEEVLVMLHERDQSRQIIIFEDVYNAITLPYKYGRALPKGFTEIPKSIGFGITPLLIESQDTGPILLGLPPDTTKSGRMRNKALNKLVRAGPMKHLIDAWVETLRGLGCTTVPNDYFTSVYGSQDAMLQLCSPSLEYARSDLPASIEFVGVLPRMGNSATIEYPAWWSDLAEAKKGSVVFVTQGTTNLDYSELIIPTMKAFSGRKDVLVVATLGVRGGKLPEDVDLAENVRVIDYFPYDTILEHSDVFVSNAGYGGFTHAVRNGVPAVLAGESEEKIEVSARAEYTGMGVSLGTQKPTVEQIKTGVERVLSDPTFKNAAMSLMEENNSMDPLGAIVRKIKDLTDS